MQRLRSVPLGRSLQRQLPGSVFVMFEGRSVSVGAKGVLHLPALLANVETNFMRMPLDVDVLTLINAVNALDIRLQMRVNHDLAAVGREVDLEQLFISVRLENWRHLVQQRGMVQWRLERSPCRTGTCPNAHHQQVLRHGAKVRNCLVDLTMAPVLHPGIELGQ